MTVEDRKTFNVGCGGRRRICLSVMRLPWTFWLLLLFSTGSLLLFLHVQNLTATLLPQPSGVKFVPPRGPLLNEERCHNCRTNDKKAPGPKTGNSSLISNNFSVQQLSSTAADQGSNNIKRLTEVQQSRKRLVKDTCAKYRNSPYKRTLTRQHLSHLYAEDKYKLLYCSVPKAGCSNWKRTLLILKGHTSSAEKLKHDLVHNGNNLRRLDTFNQASIAYRLKTYTKVFFLREPFERLVSAFRDKFESPNYFYHPTFGKPIISRYRKNPTKLALKTGDGVTFKEFIQYLLDVNRPVGMDIHWEPVVDLCNPCLIDYDFIGKMETMEEEANFLLKQIGAPANLTFPSFKDRNPSAPRTSLSIMQKYFAQLNSTERQRTYDFFYMDYLMFNYSKPFADLL